MKIYKIRIKQQYSRHNDHEIATLDKWYNERTELTRIEREGDKLSYLVTDGENTIEIDSVALSLHSFNEIKPSSKLIAVSDEPGIKKDWFIYDAIDALCKNHFLFISVAKGCHKGEILFVLSNSDNLTNHGDDTYRVCRIAVNCLGEPINMFNKDEYPKYQTFENKRSEVNHCPISTPDLIELLEYNYVAVKLYDGSKGWVHLNTTDYERYGEADEEVVICIEFGDDSSEVTFSSNISEIIDIIPKNL